jgi:hypothetical protein
VADRDRVAALIAAIASHYGGFGATMTAETAAEIARATISSREGTRFMRALDGETAVGLACFVVIRPDRNLKSLICLKDLFVPAETRGSGVGKRMMANSPAGSICAPAANYRP